MELKDTLTMMVSDDHNERLKAEYYQVRIRLEKLKNIILQYKLGKLEFELACPIDLLEYQGKFMYEYCKTLYQRLLYENVELSEEIQ